MRVRPRHAATPGWPCVMLCQPRPPPPTLRMDPRPNRPLVIQSGDVFAAADGLLYMTDFNAGLYILEYEGRS